MSNRAYVWVVLSAVFFAKSSLAQAPAAVDFRNDVLPVLKQHCISCHGPSLQMNGFRLDRRQSALRGGTGVMIVPGNSAVSRVYLKLVSDDFGMRMPPTAPLAAEQIRIIKDWVDQGARWPDDLAGDAPVDPPSPIATEIMEALRRGDEASFRKLLSKHPLAVNQRGPGGSTPLMYAALYGKLESLELLLEKGADPNLRNHDGATALMWAVHDAGKVRLLLDAKAEVDVRADDGRTPLIIAAGRHGSAAVAKLLIERGADPSTKAADGATALQQAAMAGDQATFRLLVERGADTKTAGPLAPYYAFHSKCDECADVLVQSSDKPFLELALNFMAPMGNTAAVRKLLDHGTDPNGKGFEGAPAFVRAAHSDIVSPEIMRSLIDRGADIHAKSPRGGTALDFAKLRGNTPIVDLLMKAGAGTALPSEPPALGPKPASSPREAVLRSLPLLQSSDVTFFKKSGCVSCHNNSLTAMAVSAARKHRLPVDETIARQQLKTIGSYLDDWRERVLRGLGIPGEADTVSYLMIGQAAEGYAPTPTTDAMAHYLKGLQAADGRWRIVIHRPPIESSDITVTATSLRAIRAYAPKPHKAEYEDAVRRAANWLAQATATNTEEYSFKLLGLLWAGSGKGVLQKAGRDLLAEQRSDGGWAQIPSLPSDAYATGQALQALREAGILKPSDPEYLRGIRFLLDSQLEDGSWYVRSRSMPFQPFFESGFPHGHDQWISAAATGWATLALVPAAR